MPWLDKNPPPAPKASAQRRADNNVVILTFDNARSGGEPAFLYDVHVKYGPRWRFTTVPAGAPSLTLNPDPAAGPASEIVLTAVDRCGNESDRVTVPVR